MFINTILEITISINLWLLLFTLDAFCCIIQIILLPFDFENRIYCGRIFRLIGVLACKINPLWHFSIHGNVKPMPTKAVCISNHRSFADCFLIAFLPYEIKWLSKRELFHVPIIGCSMYLAGDIPIDRNNKNSAKIAMQSCANYIEKGVPVMIFPEGTRSKVRDLLPFKDGAFRLAIETQADIQPIAVSGTRWALPNGQEWHMRPAVAKVAMGNPISTIGMTIDDIEKVKILAKKEIERLLKEMEPLTSPVDIKPL